MGDNTPTRDEILAMAAALAAIELNTDISHLRVLSFKEVKKSGLYKYIEDNNITYKKYQLGD